VIIPFSGSTDKILRTVGMRKKDREVVVESGGSPQEHELEAGVSSTSLDRDVAIKLVGVHAQEIDPLVEKRVLRKMDWFLMPAMITGASFVELDN